MGCPRYRRTPRTLPRPLATFVTLASIQLASGGLQGCRLVELMARFPLPRACARCGFGERTFAGTRGSDGNAPIGVIRHCMGNRPGATKPVLPPHHVNFDRFVTPKRTEF